MSRKAQVKTPLTGNWTKRDDKSGKFMEPRKGHEALWLWFGLSRASFLVLPRVLMHEMPDAWQGKMAKLLEEYRDEFPNQPQIGTRVQCTTSGGKLRSWPEWFLNYRHPDYAAIAKLRRQ